MVIAVSVKLPVVRNLHDLRKLDPRIEGPSCFSDEVLIDFGKSLAPPIGLSDGRLYILFNREGLGALRQSAVNAVFAKGCWKYNPQGLVVKKLVPVPRGMASSVADKMGSAFPSVLKK